MPTSRGGESDYFQGGGGGAGMSDFSSRSETSSGDHGHHGGGIVGGGAYGGHSPQVASADGGQLSPQEHLKRYRFSQEEMRAIRECNKESFYYRCLPIGTMMGLGAWYGVRYGYLKPSPRFGAGPKMFVASVVGYFVGKFSYQSVCAEKLMALPNSQLGEILRKQKGRMGFQEALSIEPGFASAAPIGQPADFSQPHGQGHVYSDVGDTRPLSSFDNDGVNFSGYDYSPSSYDTTQQMLDDENLPPKQPQFSTSYDDLRRKNRIEYESKQHSSPSAPTLGSLHGTGPAGGGLEGFQPRRTQSSQQYPPNDTQGKPINKYGDVWDDKPASF